MTVLTSTGWIGSLVPKLARASAAALLTVASARERCTALATVEASTSLRGASSLRAASSPREANFSARIVLLRDRCHFEQVYLLHDRALIR